MNLSATSAPHSSNDAPAACGAPGSATLPSPSGETTTAASAPASSPASSPGTTASHSPTPASFPLASTASAPTQRAARYGKQLVSHMARSRARGTRRRAAATCCSTVRGRFWGAST